MTTEKYKQLQTKHGNNNLMLCYEYFCEEKKQLDFNIFRQSLSMWLLQMQPDVFIFNGGDEERNLQIGVEKIVNFLKQKYNA